MPIHRHVRTPLTLRALRQANTGSKREEYMMCVGGEWGRERGEQGTRCHQFSHVFPPSANAHGVWLQPHTSHVVALLLLWQGTQRAVSAWLQQKTPRNNSNNKLPGTAPGAVRNRRRFGFARLVVLTVVVAARRLPNMFLLHVLICFFVFLLVSHMSVRLPVAAMTCLRHWPAARVLNSLVSGTPHWTS